MQTVLLNIQDNKLSLFLTILDNLKEGLIESVKVQDDVLNIEEIKEGSDDYLAVEVIKAENNKKYSIAEVKEKLGFL